MTFNIQSIFTDHMQLSPSPTEENLQPPCRCEKCEGSGLLKKGKFYRKCNECGGFFPWQGWKLFFTSTASPGNGGPLMQPRGQTSVLYKVPPKKQKPSQEDDLVPTSPGTISRSAEAQSRDGPSSP